MGYVHDMQGAVSTRKTTENEQFADDHWLRRGWGRREALVVRVVWSTVLISGFRRGNSLFKK